MCQASEQQLPALLIVILIHTDKQPDPLLPRCPFQRVCDEDSFQCLEQRPAQIVCPEGIQVGKFRELDITNNRAQIPGTKQHARSAEQFKLPLQRLLLV